MAIFYIDGTTLSNSTAVFSDAGMSTCAPDGFYSDGVIVRELSGCVLLASRPCPTCAEPCGSSIGGSGGQGIYLLDLDTGGTATDVGAIIITFNPQSIPDGIRATYDSTVYNKVSSPVDGYHGTVNAGAFTYIGDQSRDCGISGTTYPSLTEYSYVSGSGFQPTGGTQSVTVASGDVSLSTTAPGGCVMVIPKQNPSPSIVNFEFVGPCGSTGWNINIQCPQLLTGFTSTSTRATSSALACELTPTSQLFSAPVNGTPGQPGLYDWIFYDAYGASTVQAGFYNLGGTWIEVANGVVVDLGNCTAPTEYIYLSTVRSLCSDFCDGTNYTIVTQVTTDQNHSWANITIGDTISGSVIPQGYYAYAASQTDTATGVYRIMYVTNNFVEAIYVCSGGVCTPL